MPTSETAQNARNDPHSGHRTADRLAALAGQRPAGTTGVRLFGTVGGFIPAGVVGELRVDVGDDLTVAVTGPLQNRAVLESTVIDGGTAGFLTSVFDSDGNTGLVLPDGGVRVLSMGTETTIWDGKELFSFDAQGSVSASLLPGGELVGTPVELVQTENLVLGGSFLGRLDVGSVYLDSAGCADAFVSQFRLDAVP